MSLQWPEPLSLHEQSFVQSVRLQSPLPEQSIVQPLPVRERVAEPEPSDFTVQPPAGQEKVDGPLPWQTNSQPADAAGQDGAEGPAGRDEVLVPCGDPSLGAGLVPGAAVFRAVTAERTRRDIRSWDVTN